MRRGQCVQVEEAAQALREDIPPVEGIQVAAREGVLAGDPCLHNRRRTILEPPVGIGYSCAMEDLFALGPNLDPGHGWG